MSFGLHGTATTFQRLVDTELGTCDGFAIAYLAVILVYSRSWQQHLQHLSQVFQHLTEAGLRINPKKSKLGFIQLDYFGYAIGGGLVKPQPKKVEAIQDLPRPQGKKQLRRFFGMARYYIRFIPNFRAIACPLTDRLVKGHPETLKWNVDAK